MAVTHTPAAISPSEAATPTAAASSSPPATTAATPTAAASSSPPATAAATPTAAASSSPPATVAAAASSSPSATAAATASSSLSASATATPSLPNVAIALGLSLMGGSVDLVESDDGGLARSLRSVLAGMGDLSAERVVISEVQQQTWSGARNASGLAGAALGARGWGNATSRLLNASSAANAGGAIADDSVAWGGGSPAPGGIRHLLQRRLQAVGSVDGSEAGCVAVRSTRDANVTRTIIFLSLDLTGLAMSSLDAATDLSLTIASELVDSSPNVTEFVSGWANCTGAPPEPALAMGIVLAPAVVVPPSPSASASPGARAPLAEAPAPPALSPAALAALIVALLFSSLCSTCCLCALSARRTARRRAACSLQAAGAPEDASAEELLAAWAGSRFAPLEVWWPREEPAAGGLRALPAFTFADAAQMRAALADSASGALRLRLRGGGELRLFPHAAPYAPQGKSAGEEALIAARQFVYVRQPSGAVLALEGLSPRSARGGSPGRSVSARMATLRAALMPTPRDLVKGEAI